MYFLYMSERATNPAAKRPRQKKWPLRRAAKFREETPRKGGGFAIADRNAALQQYAELPACPQVCFMALPATKAPQNRRKSGNRARFCAVLLPPSAFVHCTKHMPGMSGGFTGP